jgi:hypothetical protein
MRGRIGPLCWVCSKPIPKEQREKWENTKYCSDSCGRIDAEILQAKMWWRPIHGWQGNSSADCEENSE